MRALISGATGLIGAELAARIPTVRVLTRDARRAAQQLGAVEVRAWSPEAGPPTPEALAGVDVIFNLAGEPVAQGRWTADKKRRIRDSRIVGTRHLVCGIEALATRPRVLVSASAVGVYGDRGSEELDEDAAPGSGFLADVCRGWEREAQKAELLGVRVVCLRIGLVLANDGGALARMLPLFRVGAGGVLGSGKQWMSWIHRHDVVGLLLQAANSDTLRGVMNAVAPQPVTNAEFTRILAGVLRRPAALKVPTTALRLVFGEMSHVLLASQRVVPRVAVANGYTYRYSDLRSALQAVVTGSDGTTAAPKAIRP